MFFYGNAGEGLPPSLYRSPTEIRADMRQISERICEAEEMLSVRNILLGVISEWSRQEPEKWIRELEETAEEARFSLIRLQKLRDTLCELREELNEAQYYSGL